MAGGPFAAVMPCRKCRARAERTQSGSEDDYYLCENGHRFGIDWSRTKKPTEPLWPPRDAEAAPATDDEPKS